MADSSPSPNSSQSHQPASLKFGSPVLARPNKPIRRSHWSKRISKKFWQIAANPQLVALICLLVFISLGVFTLITYIVFANSLATPEAIINRKNIGLVFYDKDGQEFYHTGEARDTTLIPIDQIPNNIKEATVAIEDKDFYHHRGFSPTSILRAVYSNVTNRDLTGVGGSTITQQLVKNALLTQKKSYVRKLQELALSIEIDRRYSKDQILQLYLTSTYYGSGAYGARDAAQIYFNKDLQSLTVAEAAMLAGLPQAPSAYSPLDGDEELAKQRQAQVLRVMQEQGYITQEEHEQAVNQRLAYGSSKLSSTNAPHFVEYVRSLVAREYGEDAMVRSGYRIYTTLDRELQSKSQEVVAKRVANLAGAGADNGSLVAIDPTNGHVLAMVGSADYDDDQSKGKYNFATEPRQPGSATKPFMYMTSFENGYTPATIVEDKLTNFGGYVPHNATGKFYGSVTIRTALANSLNIPAVVMLQRIGVSDYVDTMQNFGATSIDNAAAKRCGLSIVLGCAEVELVDLTHAYSTLASEGVYRDMLSYTKIVDKNGRQIYPKQGLFSSSKPDEGKRVINAGYTYLISEILNDNAARSMIFGSNSALKLSRPAAVKTGTTDSARDAWAIGYTPQITVGVWVGNSNNTPMTAAGASAAAPIWREVMEAYLRGKPTQWYTMPNNVVKLSVCRGKEAIAENGGDSTFSEYFIKNQVPRERCQIAPTPTPTPEVTATPTLTPTPTPTVVPTVSVSSGSALPTP